MAQSTEIKISIGLTDLSVTFGNGAVAREFGLKLREDQDVTDVAYQGHHAREVWDKVLHQMDKATAKFLDHLLTEHDKLESVQPRTSYCPLEPFWVRIKLVS